MSNVHDENKMGTEKMSRLIIATGIPLMLSLLINSLYNFVDSVFTGNTIRHLSLEKIT